MQIKDRDLPGESNWASLDDPIESRFHNSFRRGLGFVPSSFDEDVTLTAGVTLSDEPERLEEKDRIGEDTRPRR